MNTDTCKRDPRTCGHCVVGCDGGGFGESRTYPSCAKAGFIASMLGNDICGKMLRLEAAASRTPRVMKDFEVAQTAIQAIKTDDLEAGARSIVEGMLGSVLSQLDWAKRQVEWALEAAKRKEAK